MEKKNNTCNKSFKMYSRLVTKEIMIINNEDVYKILDSLETIDAECQILKLVGDTSKILSSLSNIEEALKELDI